MDVTTFCIFFVSVLAGSFALDGGTRFVFAIPEPNSQSSSEYYLHMYISATETTHVVIEAPSINLRTNKTIGTGTTLVRLEAKSVMLSTETIERKGIHVSSDRPVSVYVVNHENVYSDGFLALPYTEISTDFYICSYEPHLSSEFAIASAFDNTAVNVTLRGGNVNVNHHTYSSGQTFTINMNSLDAFQVKQTSDLTGTYIRSNRPIAVTSGNKCAQIPAHQDSCDYLVEQMPPVQTWKTKYIVGSFRSKQHLRIRVLSSENGNRISISGDAHASFNLDKGVFKELSWNGDLIVLIEATYPVLVSQYNERHAIDNSIGDPFMVTVPSTDHFADEYFFRTPTHFDSHHGTVIILTSKASGLRLDGHVISRSDEKRINVVEGGVTNSYSIIRFDISLGAHHLKHINSEVTFGMILYGYKSVDSYGLPLGWKLLGTTITDIRITNNTSSKSGVVEMQIYGVWRPVCSGGLDRTAAMIICKTLGYDKYGLPKQPITMTSYPGSSLSSEGVRHISCTGQEATISSCNVQSYDMAVCQSSDVAVVDCAPSLEEIIHIACTPTSWKISLDMDKLKYRFPGSTPSDIYLGENTCSGILNGHTLVFDYDIHTCLSSESATTYDIIFSNQLVYAYHDPKYTFIIRSFNWTMDLHCNIPRDHSVHSNVTYNETTDNVVNVLNTSISKYDISTELYQDPNFMQKIPSNPIQLPTGSNVFVKSFIRDVDWTIKMRLYSCFTTMSGVQNGGKYYLIKDGCEVDTNTHILSQTDHETKFVFRIFEMTGHHGDVDIKCEATICDTSDALSSQQCDQHCI